MNIHIALYKWKSSAKDLDVDAALRDVASLSNKVPGIVEIACGVNTSQYSDGYTHVILVRGKDRKAIDAYRNHPAHKEVAAQIEMMEEDGIGVDFET